MLVELSEQDLDRIMAALDVYHTRLCAPERQAFLAALGATALAAGHTEREEIAGLGHRLDEARTETTKQEPANVPQSKARD